MFLRWIQLYLSTCTRPCFLKKIKETEKESTFCLGCRSLTLETLEDAEHSDHETTNFFKSELESQNSDCEFQKSLGLPDFITNYFCQWIHNTVKISYKNSFQCMNSCKGWPKILSSGRKSKTSWAKPNSIPFERL